MEPDRRIRRVAIVGGGIAGWTAAVLLGKKLGGQCSIHVVESPEPAFPGLAEATQPTILELLKYLGIDQNDEDFEFPDLSALRKIDGELVLRDLPHSLDIVDGEDWLEALLPRDLERLPGRGRPRRY